MSQSQTRRSPDLLIFVVCLAQFMVILDISIVNVALPSIHDSLGFSQTGLQWVVNAYTLAFAGFLMLGGRACDLLGRRQVFLVGTALFSLASLGCAVADSQTLLIGARAIQGLGAAIISPASLAILTVDLQRGARAQPGARHLGRDGRPRRLRRRPARRHPHPELRLGGDLLHQRPDRGRCRRSPAAAIIRRVARSWPAERHFDVAGAVLISGGLTAFVFGIVRTDTLGWGSPGVLVPLLAGLAMLALFALVEGKCRPRPADPAARLPHAGAAGGEPDHRPALRRHLRDVVLRLALPAAGARRRRPAGGGRLPADDAEHRRRLDPGAAPGRPLRRARRADGGDVRPPRSACCWLSGVGASSSYATGILPGGVLATLGAGSSMVPATIVAVRGVPQQESGLASGVLNTSRLAGGTIGLAVLSTLGDLATRTASWLAAPPARSPSPTATSSPSSSAPAVCLLGAVAAATLLRRRRASAPRASRNRPERRRGGRVGACRRTRDRFRASSPTLRRREFPTAASPSACARPFAEAVAEIEDLPAGAGPCRRRSTGSPSAPGAAASGSRARPAARVEEGTLELFGHVSYSLPQGGEPADFQAKADFTDVLAEDNPDWRIDLNDDVVGRWRNENGRAGAVTLVWGRPLVRNALAATAELDGETVDQEAISQRTLHPDRPRRPRGLRRRDLHAGQALEPPRRRARQRDPLRLIAAPPPGSAKMAAWPR